MEREGEPAALGRVLGRDALLLDCHNGCVLEKRLS